MTGWRLLLTRPTAECQALAASLAEHGVFSSSLPLLATEPVPLTSAQQALMADLASYCTVIVVSKTAARLGLDLLRQHWTQPPSGPRWFSVGAATAQVLDDYLAAYGVHTHYPEQGDDSEALLALPALEQALQATQPRVLLIRGEGGRELIADTLRRRGATLDYLELYRRVCPQYPAGTLAQRVAAERLNALLVSSAQGLEHLRLQAADSWMQLARLPLLVPSPRVAALARSAGARQVIDCRGASAAAVLAALRAHPAPAN